MDSKLIKQKTGAESWDPKLYFQSFGYITQQGDSIPDQIIWMRKKKTLLQNENQNWAIFMMIGLTPGSYWSILFLATLSLFALQVCCYNTIPQ